MSNRVRMDDTIYYYTRNAEQLAEQYDSLAFEQVHSDWLDLVPAEGFVLDVGAGSGRDARYLAERGLTVYAVEPADGIREHAQQYHPNPSIHWINDSLPDLTHVQRQATKFDLILLSAVWMHIAPSSRQRAFRKLSKQAWHEHDREFFTQAMFALPDLTLGHMSFDDVFEAMMVQRDRIKQVQQLQDW